MCLNVKTPICSLAKSQAGAEALCRAALWARAAAQHTQATHRAWSQDGTRCWALLQPHSRINALWQFASCYRCNSTWGGIFPTHPLKGHTTTAENSSNLTKSHSAAKKKNLLRALLWQFQPHASLQDCWLTAGSQHLKTNKWTKNNVKYTLSENPSNQAHTK